MDQIGNGNLVNREKRGAVALLKLNRPEKLNAMTRPMLDELAEALEEAERDEETRVVVLAGEGRAFSAGYDLDLVDSGVEGSKEDRLRAELGRDFESVMRIWNYPKPVIAAVHGYCLGYAMEITAACDLSVAAEGCRFGVPEARFGSGVICLILPWIIGQKHARELLLVGSDKVDAKRAEAIGLVNRVVAADALLEDTLALANEIALNDPVSVRLTKRALNGSLEAAGLRQALLQALELDVEIEMTDTPESVEFNRILEEDGPKAALEWRAAQLPKE
jgi:enoyl-CoA hydratase